MNKWDIRFFKRAQEISTWSKEHGKRVGAIIVDDNNVARSEGFNGFPRGINDDVVERHGRESGMKYLWSVHAEQNAIFNAVNSGTRIKGCRMYVTVFPCTTCAKAAIQCGIKEIIAPEPDFNDPKWGEEFRVVQEMLEEAGILFRHIDIKQVESLEQKPQVK